MERDDPVNENQGTPHASGKRGERLENTERSAPIGRAVAQPHPTESLKGDTSERRKAWWDKSKPWVEIAGVLLTCSLYRIYYRNVFR
jgi:hypothetical protein